MRVPHNKKEVTENQISSIRKMFFLKKEMKDIEKKVDLTERVIRRIIKEKKWNQARERYYKMLCQKSLSLNVPLSLISEQAGVNYYGLCRIRKKYRICKAKKKAWNDRRTAQLEREVIDLYDSGLTAQQIVDRIGYKRKETVYQILEKNEINRREPKIQTYYDESFFENIDTHEKAYVLGLIMTDGNIIKDYKGFEIQLTEEDGYILEKISDLIGASKTHFVQKINYSNVRKKGGTLKNARDMVRLSVYNQKIAEDLKKMGVVKNKTKVIRYNDCVPDEFMGSFFRGLIDGDGHIGIGKNGTCRCSLYSESLMFIEDLKKIALPFNFSIIQNGRNLNVLGGKDAINDFLKWIYSEKGDFYLRRKYEKVQDKIS